MIRTKICGIRSLDDLLVAEKAGTDAVGFLVGQRHASNSFIDEAEARALRCKSAPFISTVVVTHLEAPQEIIRMAAFIGSSEIQLHSDLSVQVLSFLRQNIQQKIIGKVSVSDLSAIARAQEIEPYVDAILLDSINMETNQVGGTGKVHDWSISAEIVRTLHKPIILAGGLNPQNVGMAIEKVSPWGVDVNTGVTENGRKSEKLAREFVRRAKCSIG